MCVTKAVEYQSAAVETEAAEQTYSSMLVLGREPVEYLMLCWGANAAKYQGAVLEREVVEYDGVFKVSFGREPVE